MRSVTCRCSIIVCVLLVASSARAEDAASWIYDQSSGELSHGDEVVATGYSGHGEGLNNPAKEDVRNVGPIPRGKYAIGKAFAHDIKGPVVMRLTPIDHDARGRDGFLIHGDNKRLNQSASNGCIILPRSVREKIANSEITTLIVVE